jgi:hypothetical protein
VDADATPMCAVACIAGAIVFGDLDDPASRVRTLIAATNAAPLAPECGTEPSVYYVTGDGPQPEPERRVSEPADDACPVPRSSRSRARHGFDRPAVVDPALVWLRTLGE